MLVAEIIIGQLANSPCIEAKLGIRQITVWNVTVSFVTLKKNPPILVRSRTRLSYPVFSPRVPHDERLRMITVADGQECVTERTENEILR